MLQCAAADDTALRETRLKSPEVVPGGNTHTAGQWPKQFQPVNMYKRNKRLIKTMGRIKPHEQKPPASFKMPSSTNQGKLRRFSELTPEIRNSVEQHYVR